jgi:hypothetical protein
MRLAALTSLPVRRAETKERRRFVVSAVLASPGLSKGLSGLPRPICLREVSLSISAERAVVQTGLRAIGSAGFVIVFTEVSEGSRACSRDSLRATLSSNLGCLLAPRIVVVVIEIGRGWANQ